MDRRIVPHLRFHLLRVHQFLYRLNPRSRPRRRPIQRMSWMPLLYRPLLFRPRLNLFRLRLKLLRLRLNLFRPHRLVLQLTKTGLRLVEIRVMLRAATTRVRNSMMRPQSHPASLRGRRQNRTWRSECRRASMRNNFTAPPNFPFEAHRRPRMSSQRKPFAFERSIRINRWWPVVRFASCSLFSTPLFASAARIPQRWL